MDLCRYDDPDRGETYFKQCFVNHDENDQFKEGSYQGYCDELLSCKFDTQSCEEREGVEKQGITKDFYNSQLEEHYEKEEEHAFERKASVIFNAFIFMQV